MAKFYDLNNWISQEWNKPQKGSRSNTIFENPETSELYYFKLSKENFPSEFWSEIIASKVGQLIGYNVLDYNVGISNHTLGCLSKSMIDKEKGQTLYHGVDVLNDNLKDFEVSSKPVHSFQDLLRICLENKSCESFVDDFVKLIIFDSLIGNTDRHTENWAFIIQMSLDFENISNDETKSTVRIDILNTLRSLLKLRPALHIKSPILNVRINQKFQFSPIYDSGSCLGREISESKLIDYCNDKSLVSQYINKGKSEIRWNNERLNLFDILERVKANDPSLLERNINEKILRLNDADFEDLVNNIDSEVVGKVEETYLSLNRKNFIKEILKQRLKHLRSIVQGD